MMQQGEALPGLLGAVALPMAAFGLAMARCLGLLQILPIATRLGLRGMHRAGVAAALSVLLVPMILPGLKDAAASGAHLALLAAKEALVGFVLGLLFAAPFWTAETAGELIDQQRGSRSGTAPDPAGLEESGPTATLLVLTLATLFLLSGGMNWLLDGVFDSYRIWPAAELVPRLGAGAGTQLLELLDSILAAGFLLAAPLVVAMLLAELSLALVSRFAPQLNVFDLSMSLKGLVYVVRAIA